MPLAPNQQLFEYRILRVLDQGAFGTLYLAHDTFPTGSACTDWCLGVYLRTFEVCARRRVTLDPEVWGRVVSHARICAISPETPASLWLVEETQT